MTPLDVRAHSAARAEYLEAWEWYEARSREAADAFEAEVQASLGLVVDRPEAWPIVRSGVRKKILDGFPYNLVFVSEASGVYLLAVAHQKRHPDYWIERIER